MVAIDAPAGGGAKKIMAATAHNNAVGIMDTRDTLLPGIVNTSVAAWCCRRAG